MHVRPSPSERGCPSGRGSQVSTRNQRAPPSKQSLWKTTISCPQNYSKSIKLNQKNFHPHAQSPKLHPKPSHVCTFFTIQFIKLTHTPKTSFQSVALLLSALVHYSRHIICSLCQFFSCSLVSSYFMFNSDANCFIKAISCSTRGSLCSK